MRRFLSAALASGLVFCGGLLPALAQEPDYGDPARFDRRPPPPPPPFDEAYGPGYRRSPPIAAHYRRASILVCRTPEGDCASRALQAYRAPCGCDFGDGWVRGRMRP